jgi:hypothetical protein
MTEEKNTYDTVSNPELETALNPETGELTPTIGIERIDALCKRIMEQHMAVAEAELDLADARSTVEETKARIIGQGYANGTIDGSNKQTRDAQEGQLLAESEALAQARLAVREADRALAQAKANLAGNQERVSLYRAFLYSTARMPR